MKQQQRTYTLAYHNRPDISRIIFITGLIFFVLTWCWLFSAGHQTALAGDSEAADIPVEKWDYGYLPQKVEVSHTFYVVNTDTAALSISKIKIQYRPTIKATLRQALNLKKTACHK